MRRERRLWIRAECEREFNGDIKKFKPDYFDKNFYKPPPSLEEIQAQAALDAEAAASGGAKKVKEKKAKKAKAKKDKKGKKASKGDDSEKKKKDFGGPLTQVIDKFDQQYVMFNENWVNRDESENYKQQYDESLAKEEIKPVLKEQYKLEVDKLIRNELEIMKIQAGKKPPKPKKGKGKGKKKGGKKKGPKSLIPNFKMMKEFVDEAEGKAFPKNLLIQLVRGNICKKIPPTALSEFIGEFNYNATQIENIDRTMQDPSMALIRQLITEYIIFPLGSKMVHDRGNDNKTKSFLFYGPAGSGKSLAVRAAVHETNSIFFDISPQNIEQALFDWTIAKPEDKDQLKIFAEPKEPRSAQKSFEKIIASILIVAEKY